MDDCLLWVLCAVRQRSLLKLITRPEESYRLWCVVVCALERGQGPMGVLRQKQTKKLICVSGWTAHRTTVRPGRVTQRKIQMTTSGIEPATFRLVVQYLNQLCHSVLNNIIKYFANKITFARSSFLLGVPTHPFRQSDCRSDKAMTQRSTDRGERSCGGDKILAAKCCVSWYQERPNTLIFYRKHTLPLF